jgi:hypothetical protein
MIYLIIFYWIFSTLCSYNILYTVGIEHKIRIFIICVLFGSILLPLLLGDILGKIYNKTIEKDNENK